ncbi:hypothetical protein H6CHR_01534 [Variovorax sp. PBL-H6]|uniref:hypothetical protein n=1 Tax=Variovorax sp. PBL-H6 TaxID=434009 RepID=UPI00131953DA|nr:hypothetical protein [Variovorax sp. PBL-H6]VTU21160.1 hypothetical protein H6CHR_01534 [Variovorax sp. PBL-H6]
MHWNDCYDWIQRMSPKAAKLVSRMLCKDPLVPSHWFFALDVALKARANGAEPLTAADLDAIAATQREQRPEPEIALDKDQREAWAFTAALRSSAVRDAKKDMRALAPSHEDPLWDPRTPTPEEAWLLAFSDELHRLSNDRFSAQAIARCAIDRLQTDAHRSPLVVAREQFLAASIKPMFQEQAPVRLGDAR